MPQCDSNLIEFKRARVKARKILKQAKKNSWINYIASLTKTTPCEQIWNKLKKINGHKGSVLSVFLFLIAINDIAEVFCKPVKHTIFADDCTFFITGKSLSTSQQILQDNLDRLQKYALQTGFKFSKKKTTVTIFSKQRTTQNHQLQLHLGQHQLMITSTPKILGLIFDNKYTWTLFFKKLKEECVNRLNILKIIASKNWGAEFQILLNSYKALVLFQLDYGSIVYDSGKPRVLKLLAPIHNAGARIATGAFRTSPVTAILCEAGLTPLETRRKQLNLSYAATRLSTPSNPIYEQLTNTAHFNEFKEKPKLPKPLNNRVKTYWQELNMDTPKIISRIQYQIPPWTIDPPCILEKILEARKNTNSNVLKSLYTELSNEYPHHTQIVTDASKSGQGTGCAVCTPEHELLFRLPETFTVFTSEALAVLQALKYIEETTHNKSIILTDSKSTLLALQNLETNNSVIQNIIELNETLKRDKREVLYSWVPAHIGIEGNEKADTAAKLASSSTAIMKYEQATHQDLQKYCTKALTGVWNEEWRNSRPTKLHKVRNNIYDFNPALPLNRKDQVKTTRLRIGHSSWTHSYLITKTEPNSCDICNVENTIEHILTICPKYNMKRIQHKLQNSLTILREIDSCKKVLNLLKDIKVCQLL
ncbi:uncharacterized protein LOC122400522 [Colletes gigas]|uniref:uncharacterized protein LOC122400522 n=1 Tax=Colletes gigas TaxID=935657 RepID=UPI001C9A68BD|nr:uncharacterized protein LOC122400522 [Colletes gigas]